MNTDLSKTPAGAKPIRTVDITPTWSGLMPALLAAVRDGTPVGRRAAEEELLRLAREVDRINAASKAAPRLVEALEELKESAEAHGLVGPVIDRAEAALAAAKGRT